MNTEKLIQDLKASKGFQFASLIAQTEAQKSKAKQATKVIKVAYMSIGINGIYQNAVQNRQVEAGNEKDFTALPNWFEHVSPCLVTHKKTGKLYLFAQVIGTFRDSRYFVNGKEYDKAEISHLLRVHAPSQRQDNAGVNREVIVRTIAIENICSMAFSGNVYSLRESLVDQANFEVAKGLHQLQLDYS